MEDYPEELRTPPVPLVALVGVPELHSIISSYLHMEPLPINALALPDFSKVSVIGGKERRPADARLPPPVGILKVDWLRKHRTRIPAAVVVLLSRDEVNGDPAQLLHVYTNLDRIKNIIRDRNTKLVIVVMQQNLFSGEIIEERLVALRKRADLDAKFLLSFVIQEPMEQRRSLARLGSVLGELVMLFYKAAARRVKLRIEKKAFSSSELSARYNFKVAVFAEFRRDWTEALKFYEMAYNSLQEAHILTSPMELQSVQHLVGLKMVAEQLHFKVSTLLLHGGKEVEAVKWFRQHIHFYKGFTGPLDGHFLHWSWMSKQFLVFGDLLQNSLTIAATTSKPQTSLLDETLVTERELQPGYYYQVAAQYMLERYHSFRSTSSILDAFEADSMVDVLDGSPEEVGSPLYVGQPARLLRRGTSVDSQQPTDREYMYHAVQTEKLFPHSAAAIGLLKKAYEHYKLLQTGRMVSFVACQMGRVYFNARDYANAKHLLDTVAGVYRQEAWVALLWATLGFLRECARQLQLLMEFVQYSLEMAALPTFPDSKEHGTDSGFMTSFEKEVGPAGPLCHSQREQVCRDVLGMLKGQHSVLPARDGEMGLMVAETDPVTLEIDVASPLRAVLQVCVAFHEQTVKPGTAATFTLSLMTHLPQILELKDMEVFFNQSSCNLLLQNTEMDGEHGAEAKKGFDLVLEPHKWKRFLISVIPDQSGKLECLKVVARVGQASSILCQVESPASWEDLTFWKYEACIETLPVKDSYLSSFGQRTIQVEDQDSLVDLFLEAMGPALVGEYFPVTIRIKSRSNGIHAGEVKLSLTEASDLPMLNSPRIPDTGEVSLVELYTMCNQEEAVDNPTFCKFSGLLLIPSMTTENDWVKTLYLKWMEVKPINLHVMLSYHQCELGTHETTQLRMYINKGIQLDCEGPFFLSNKYMAPFRKDALVLGDLGKAKAAGKVSLPVNETSTLVSTLHCSCSVKLELLLMKIEPSNSELCKVEELNTTASGNCKKELTERHSLDNLDAAQSVTISKGESFSKLFFVKPLKENPSLDVGTMTIRWRRLGGEESNMVVSEFIPLPDIWVEKPSLIATFQCPPQGVQGVPFSLSLCVENCTPLFQEVTYSIVDSPGFILSGSHSDSLHVLPYSKDVISCKLISISCGLQQLPQFNLTAMRYNAGFKQSLASSQIFISPSTSSKP